MNLARVHRLMEAVKRQLAELDAQPLPHSLGVPRSQMPQIKSTFVPEFLSQLKGDGIRVRMGTMPVGAIKPTQRELDVDTAKAMLQAHPEAALAKPVIVSADHFLLDGHHRWAALYMKGPGTHIQTVQVDLPIRALLKAAGEFGRVGYKAVGEAMDLKRINRLLESTKHELREAELKGKPGQAAKSGDVRHRADGDYKRQGDGTWKLVKAKPGAKHEGKKYATCPECDANFPVSSLKDPLPPHRAFSGHGTCPGSGKLGEGTAKLTEKPDSVADLRFPSDCRQSDLLRAASKSGVVKHGGNHDTVYTATDPHQVVTQIPRHDPKPGTCRAIIKDLQRGLK